MNSRQLLSDPVTTYFESLGYTTSWDFKRSTGEEWYEILKDHSLVLQIDMGVPLADIVEDLTCMAAGNPGISKSDYEMNCKQGDARFDELLKCVAQNPL